MSDTPAASPGTDLRRTSRSGGFRAAVRSSLAAAVAAALGVGFLLLALRETRPRDALALGIAGLALLAVSAIHYASEAMAKVTVEGDRLRVRGVSGTVEISAPEIEGWRRDGTSAVLRLRRPGLRRLRLPARVRLDEDFFAWLEARATRPD